LRQRVRSEACKIGVLKEISLDGENLTSKQTAGYAKRIPIGLCNLFLKIIPIRAQTRFPPAESPTSTIFVGFILEISGSLLTKNQ
jgi:hypothetical protein